MTESELVAIIKGLAPVLREKFDQQKAQITALEQRIAALEQRRSARGTRKELSAPGDEPTVIQ